MGTQLAERETGTRQGQYGQVLVAATFATPIPAQYQGNPCHAIATGDVEGSSPSFLIVTEDGASRWVPLSGVKLDLGASMAARTGTSGR